MAYKNTSKVFHSNFFAMGTRMDMVLPQINGEEGDEIFQAIRLEVKRLERKLSRFDQNGSIFNINKNAYKQEIMLDNELFNIISDCKEYYEKSLGYFDITQRKMMDYWKLQEEDERKFQMLVKMLGADKIHLDEKKNSLRFENEYIEIDLGGYGKGYALENVRGILSEHAVSKAFLSFGGSSVLTVGSHPHGEYWGVGIRNLYVPTENAYAFKICNKSVSTSGVTPLKKGSKWGHVINPKSGNPVEGSKTVSVSASSPLQSEILSTVLLISERNNLKRILNQFTADEVVEVVYPDDKHFQVNKLL